MRDIIDVIYDEYFDKNMALTLTKEKILKLQNKGAYVEVSLTRFKEENVIGFGVLLTVRDNS